MVAETYQDRARFELRSGETWREPWPMYSALREHDPVHHVVAADRPENDYWVLTRHEHVYAAPGTVRRSPRGQG